MGFLLAMLYKFSTPSFLRTSTSTPFRANSCANSEDKRASGQDANFQLYALVIKSVTRHLNRHRRNRV